LISRPGRKTPTPVVVGVLVAVVVAEVEVPAGRRTQGELGVMASLWYVPLTMISSLVLDVRTSLILRGNATMNTSVLSALHLMVTRSLTRLDFVEKLLMLL
jgi:hypothetical protein